MGRKHFPRFQRPGFNLIYRPQPPTNSEAARIAHVSAGRHNGYSRPTLQALGTTRSACYAQHREFPFDIQEDPHKTKPQRIPNLFDFICANSHTWGAYHTRENRGHRVFRKAATHQHSVPHIPPGQQHLSVNNGLTIHGPPYPPGDRAYGPQSPLQAIYPGTQANSTATPDPQGAQKSYHNYSGENHAPSTIGAPTLLRGPQGTPEAHQFGDAQPTTTREHQHATGHHSTRRPTDPYRNQTHRAPQRTHFKHERPRGPTGPSIVPRHHKHPRPSYRRGSPKAPRPHGPKPQRTSRNTDTNDTRLPKIRATEHQGTTTPTGSDPRGHDTRCTTSHVQSTNNQRARGNSIRRTQTHRLSQRAPIYERHTPTPADTTLEPVPQTLRHRHFFLSLRSGPTTTNYTINQPAPHQPQSCTGKTARHPLHAQS